MSEIEVNEIEVNGTKYVKASATSALSKVDGLDYVIVRSNGAGVFAGYLEEDNGEEVILKNARRLWYWDGAASCSQLANDGVSKPDNCKFPAPVGKIKILKVVEIIYATEIARQSLEGVRVWSA